MLCRSYTGASHRHGRLKLWQGHCLPVGRKSPYSLYREDLATFCQDQVYKQKDAEGFIKLFGLPQQVWNMVNKK